MERRTDLRWLALAVTLLCLALQWPVELLMGLLFPLQGQDVQQHCAAVAAGETALWLLPALLLLPWRTRRLGSRKNVRKLILAALPLGALLQVGQTNLRLLLPLPVSASSLPQPRSPEDAALLFLALAVVPAVCEEAFFRGGLLGHLRDTTSPVWTFVLTTLIFALMHGSLTGLAGHVLISACCTLLMMHTGRIAGPMLMHFGYNAMGLAMPYLPSHPSLGALCLIPLVLLSLAAADMRWTSGEKHLSRADAVLLGAVLACSALRLLLRA